MAQAETTTTPSRDSVQATVTAFPSFSPQSPHPLDGNQPGLLGSYAHMLGRLMENRPQQIRYEADHWDLYERAEHAEKLLLTVRNYLKVLLHDTNSVSRSARIDCHYVENVFHDMIGDVSALPSQPDFAPRAEDALAHAERQASQTLDGIRSALAQFRALPKQS